MESKIKCVHDMYDRRWTKTEKDCQSHLNQHVLFGGLKVHSGLIHVLANVDDVSQQLFIARDLYQCGFQCVTYFVLDCQVHGQVLRVLQGLLIRHHFQKLSSSVGIFEYRSVKSLMKDNPNEKQVNWYFRFANSLKLAQCPQFKMLAVH